MRQANLEWPDGYLRTSQAVVGLFAAQLDDQLKRLKKAVDGLIVEQLEWQPHVGMNSIGMLLAHLAGVEVWWINIAPREIPWKPDGEREFESIFGMEGFDDGMPLKPDGRHPDIIKGMSLTEYLKFLDIARASVHGELKKWKDSDLEKTFTLRDEKISREWTLYHVLEHFAGHFGQILLLKHLMRDAGVLAKEVKA